MPSQTSEWALSGLKAGMSHIATAMSDMPRRLARHRLAIGPMRSLRYLRHMSVLFALPLIVVIWAAALSHIANERSAARHAVIDDAATLTRVLEENVIRTVSEIDRALMFMRARFERDSNEGATDTTSAWLRRLRDANLISDLMLQTAVINADGQLIATNTAQQATAPISLADRPHFKIHSGNPAQDRLYISAPVLGRASGKWSVQLTRRFNKSDGHFGGVLVASLDPKQLSRLHDAVDTGMAGTVAIVGADGIVRVGSGRDAPAMGDDLSGSPTFKAFRDAVQGSYLQPASSALAAGQAGPSDVPPVGMSDGIDNRSNTRVVSFRRVRDLPLVVMVSAADYQADSSYIRNRRLYLLTAITLTVATLLGMLFGLRHERRMQVIRHDLKRSEARASAKSRELELTFNHMNQGIMMVDGQGRIGFMNGQAARLLDLPEVFVAAQLRYADIIAHLKAGNDFGGPTGAVDPQLLSYIENSDRQAVLPLYERVRPNGVVIEVRNEALPDGGFVRTITDVTQRHRSAAQISHLARHDVLTNLANRRLFQEHLEQARLAHAQGACFAILSIDLDRFKPVNDTLGHPIGDKLLQAVARRLSSTVRDSDVVARMGGDEFCIIQRHIGRQDQAGSLARRLIKALAKPFEIDSHMIEIGGSVGIAFAGETDAGAGGARSDDIVKAADLALYSAKTNGRGTYRFFEPEMHATVQKRQALELDLRQALNNGQFCLFYQPIQDFSSGTVTGFEALLRWRHPERGLVPPGDFIPVAEEMGLIVPIGAWVLDTATMEASRWPHHVRVSVNLSAVQFRNPGLIVAVRNALTRSGLEPSRLELEITESTLMVKDQSTLEQLHELRAIGVHISMDDFGTGYSSLSYLLSFPFDKIKIDRAFIAELSPAETDGRKGSAAIIRATTDLANSLGITTTAEGIETQEQFDRLKDLGCTEAQGYLLSKPRPVEDIPAMLLALAKHQLSEAAPDPGRGSERAKAVRLPASNRSLR
jgi:diguanylate cyclase (GGDEF)-like protein